MGAWVKEIGEQRGDAHYEIVDIADYQLPFFGTTDGTEPGIVGWSQKLASLDGFIFIVQAYNHSITGALKNALDSARDAWHDKAAGIIIYGAVGGVRAAEHLRGILAELKMADVKTQPALSVFFDFENRSTFNPQLLHLQTVNTLLDEVMAWSAALKTLQI